MNTCVICNAAEHAEHCPLKDRQTIPALTVCQPYAWALIYSSKHVENRTWKTDYRGPLAIHAGRSRQWLKYRIPDSQPGFSDLIFGAVIGIVTLHDIRPFGMLPGAMRISGWANGPQCWMVKAPIAVEPIPYSGAQGMWQLPCDVFMRPAA